jgi:hypothetical protein
MKTFACAVAAAAAIAFTTPALSQDVSVRIGTGVHHPPGHVTVIKKKRYYAPHRTVIIKRDHGRHYGWDHSRHYGANKRVIIER